MSRKQYEEPILGEWQYDEWGRKFRKVGNSIEYATVIQTTHGAVYADELKDCQNRWKQQEEQQKEQAHFPQRLQKICPFKMGRHDLHTNCVSDCAFYDDSACMFARTDMKPTKDTKDRYCPIATKCRDNCALYNSGCALTCIVKGLKPGKE